MRPTDSDLAAIVARGAPFHERLRSERVAAAPAADADAEAEHAAIEERLARWCESAAAGDWEAFERRLRWDGLSVDAARAASRSFDGEGSSRHAEAIGALARLIASATEHADPSSLRGLDLPVDAAQPLPFEDVLLPFVVAARRELCSRLGIDAGAASRVFHPRLAASACRDLERALLQSLSALHVDTLAAELDGFRPFGYGAQSLIPGSVAASGSRRYYNAFVESLLQDGLLSLFRKYPVLARLSVVAVDSWVGAVADFLHHLEADRRELIAVFGDLDARGCGTADGGFDEVAAIEPALSDRHRGGRTVMTVSFRCGPTLVYKPRSLAMEAALQRLLAWCNANDPALPFRTVRVLDKETHGWMELVEQRSCADLHELRRFYRRAGRLLGVLYAFGGSDCHRENLVANGEHPVLIDAEVLLSPDAVVWGEAQAASADAPGHRQLWDSVLRTALLPRWQLGADESVAYDISALGSVDAQPAPTPLPRWEAVNTDDMRRVHERVDMPPLQNAPSLAGRTVRPHEHVAEVIAGFQELYRLLIARRDELLGSADLLAALRRCRPRLLVRDTQVYGVTLRRALAPQCLRDGAARGIELEVLCRAYLAAAERPSVWPLLRAEIAALEQLDVPYASSTFEGTALLIDHAPPVDPFLERSASEHLHRRLRRLDEGDLAWQCRVIRDAFQALAARPGDEASLQPARAAASAGGFDREPREADAPQRLLSGERFVRAAAAIAAEIAERALMGADGSASWVDLQLLPKAGRLQLQPLGAGLYDGCCGVALFLAAFERVTGDACLRPVLEGALCSLRALLRSPDTARGRRSAHRLGVGGLDGLGSIVYALGRAARLLDDGALLEDARRAAELVTADRLMPDTPIDVLTGSAGALLGLLALHRETGDAAAMDRAVLCGRHVMQGIAAAGGWARPRAAADGSAHARGSTARPALTGFSHGAAGIAYAMLRLYETTSDRAFLVSARDAIAYETSVFSDAMGNWPDYRPLEEGREPAFVVRWCHGAAGIGLARLGGLAVLDTADMRHDVEVALAAERSCGCDDVDHLCCGSFGRLELLLEAGRRLGRPELIRTAQVRAHRLVEDALQAGGYRLHRDLPREVYSPGFFRGTAGIGYALLRLTAPESLPSPLLLE